MTTTFERLLAIDGPEAVPILRSIDERGEEAVFAALCREFEAGTGSVVTSHVEPWTDAEHIYADGEYLLYYDSAASRVGLICVLD